MRLKRTSWPAFAKQFCVLYIQLMKQIIAVNKSSDMGCIIRNDNLKILSELSINAYQWANPSFHSLNFPDDSSQNISAEQLQSAYLCTGVRLQQTCY